MPRARKDGETGLTNQSTEKALAIIETLAAAGAPMRLTDIAASLGYNQSTVLRFLSSLINSGYVMQEAGSQKYRLTYKISRIANMLNARQDIARVSHPCLVRLSEEFGESACISIEQQMQMVYIDVATGQNKMLMSMQQVGNTCPMHCTGNGKLLLTTYSEQRLDRLIAERGLERFGPNTITTKEALLRELDGIRRAGYAIDNEECGPGVRCVAYPLRDYTGEIIAGLSVTGPASRVTDEKIAKDRGLIERAASEISQELGYGA